MELLEVEKTSLHRGKICRQDPTFGSLKQVFRYIGACYIRVMCHTNDCNFAVTKECSSL